MTFYKRFLINWMDIHGKAYSRSRRISLQRLITMGIGV